MTCEETGMGRPKKKKKVEIVVIFSLYIEGDCNSNVLTFVHPILGFKDKNKFSSHITRMHVPLPKEKSFS